MLHGPERARSSPMMVATVLAGVQQAPKAMQPADVQARGSAAQPLWWLHIPKCGTSFINTLYHYACPRVPRAVKADATVDPSMRAKLYTEPHCQRASPE